MIEQVLKNAKSLLVEMDNKIDELEGQNNHQAMLDLQQLLLEWNLIGHDFATNGIQDWIKSESKGDMDDISLRSV